MADPPPPVETADASSENARQKAAAERNAHTFGQVAIARGSKWAEASMANLHKKERQQAVQILQLRQDLERFKAAAEASSRELAELKQHNREQVREPSPNTLIRTGGGGVALPRLGRQRDDASAGADHDAPPRTRSRGGHRSRPTSGLSTIAHGRRSDAAAATPVAATADSDADDAPPPPALPPLPAASRGGNDHASEELEAKRASLAGRCAELEAELETTRAAARERESDLRAETIRLSSKYESRVSAAASVQHGLEARLAEARGELAAAKEACAALEREVERARADGRADGLREGERRAKEPEELFHLRKERVELKQENAALRAQLELLGGRIKTLTGQTEETSAEQRSFLRTLAKMQKEQLALEKEDDAPNRPPGRSAGLHSSLRSGGGGGGGGGGRLRPRAPAVPAVPAVPAPPPQKQQQRPAGRPADAQAATLRGEDAAAPDVDTHVSPLKPSVRAPRPQRRAEAEPRRPAAHGGSATSRSGAGAPPDAPGRGSKPSGRQTAPASLPPTADDDRAARRKQQMAAKLEAIVKRHEASEAARAEMQAAAAARAETREGVTALSGGAAAGGGGGEAAGEAAGEGVSPTPPSAAAAAVSSGAASSPRRAEKRRAHTKYEMIAELDPEGAARRKAIDALKQRMKAIES